MIGGKNIFNGDTNQRAGKKTQVTNYSAELFFTTAMKMKQKLF
jgi:hypothetical protein